MVNKQMFKRRFTEELVSSNVVRKPALGLITGALEDFSGIEAVQETRIGRNHIKNTGKLEIKSLLLITSSVVISHSRSHKTVKTTLKPAPGSILKVVSCACSRGAVQLNTYL